MRWREWEFRDGGTVSSGPRPAAALGVRGHGPITDRTASGGDPRRILLARADGRTNTAIAAEVEVHVDTPFFET